MERDRSRILRFKVLHCARESIAQPFDHLKEREIDIGNLLAQNVFASFPMVLQYSLEIVEKLRHALRGEVGGAALGFGLLIFIIKAPGDRMMRIVRFGDPIGNRELQLMRP